MSKIQQTQKREYQDRDYKAIEDAFDRGESVMYQLPTGGGKSVIVARVVEKHKTEKILFVVHRRELLFQMTKRLRGSNLKTGLIVGSIKEDVGSNILLISMQTLVRDKAFESILSKPWDKIIIDEAHRIRTPSYDKILDQLLLINPKLLILGVTATPYRHDKKDFKKYVRTLITSDNIPSLIEKGYLCKYRTYSINIGDIDSEVGKNQHDGDYQIASLSQYMRKEGYLQALVDIYKKNGEERQMLIFAVDKKHAQSIIEVYTKNGYTKLGYIDADTSSSKREKTLLDFESKEVQILISIETLTEGVDLPDTGCIQCARPTESLVLYSQYNGRGMRPKSDGSDLIILDCAGNTQKFGTVSSPRHWTLDPIISPLMVSKKNRIVGKKADGSYTEDVDELDYLELVEMTPEEYLINISGNVEKAKEFNEQVERTILEKKISIGELILKRTKITDMEVVPNKWDKTRFKIALKSNHDYSVEIREEGRQNQLELSLSTAYSREGGDFAKADFYIRVGEIYKVVKQPEVTKLIKDSATEISELEDSKIDTDELMTKIEGFKKAEFLKELDTILRSGILSFKFSRTRTLGSHFRDLSGRWNIVEFDKPALLFRHTVTFREERVASKYEIQYYGKKEGEILVEHRGSYAYMDKKKILEVIYPMWDSLVKEIETV